MEISKFEHFGEVLKQILRQHGDLPRRSDRPNLISSGFIKKYNYFNLNQFSLAGFSVAIELQLKREILLVKRINGFFLTCQCVQARGV